MSVWRYKIKEPFTLTAPELVGKRFANDWLTINPEGWLCISAGYAFDGCSPAWRIPGTRIWIGTPDGPLLDDGRPQTFYAALVHDAFCQFHDDVPLTKQAVTEIFYRMLLEYGFPKWRAALYRAAVWNFGPQAWGNKLIPVAG